MPAPNVARLLADVARALKTTGARWYVFGAQAVIAAGVPRATGDIDVTIDAIEVKKLVSSLRKAGFKVRPEVDAAEFLQQTHVLPFEHATSGYGLDVVLAGPGLEEEFLGRALIRRIGRASIPFIDTNDLIVVKVLAGRPKDLEDVASLLRIGSAEVEPRVIRARLRRVEQAIDDSTLVRQFDALRIAAQKR